MLTPHEAAVAHLKTLARAEHPALEEVLAVVRQYPVAVQAACEEVVKRTGEVALVDPIKAIADHQAVELQELLDALTAPAPQKVRIDQQAQERHDLGLSVDPLDPTQQAGPVSTTLPKHPGDPDPNLGAQIGQTFPGAPFTGSASAESPRSALFPHEVAVGTPPLGGAGASGAPPTSFQDAQAAQTARDNSRIVDDINTQGAPGSGSANIAHPSDTGVGLDPSGELHAQIAAEGPTAAIGTVSSDPSDGA